MRCEVVRCLFSGGPFPLPVSSLICGGLFPLPDDARNQNKNQKSPKRNTKEKIENQKKDEFNTMHVTGLQEAKPNNRIVKIQEPRKGLGRPGHSLRWLIAALLLSPVSATADAPVFGSFDSVIGQSSLVQTRHSLLFGAPMGNGTELLPWPAADERSDAALQNSQSFDGFTLILAAAEFAELSAESSKLLTAAVRAELAVFATESRRLLTVTAVAELAALAAESLRLLMAAAAAELATFCDLAADSLSLIEVQLQDFRFCLEHVVFQTLAAFAKLQLPWTTHDTCLQLVWLGSLGLNGVFLDMLSNPRTIVWPTTFGHVLAVSFGLCPGLLGFFLLRSAWCGLSPWFFALGFLGPCLLLSWLRSFWRWGWRLLPARAVLCEWCAVGLLGGWWWLFPHSWPWDHSNPLVGLSWLLLLGLVGSLLSVSSVSTHPRLSTDFSLSLRDLVAVLISLVWFLCPHYMPWEFNEPIINLGWFISLGIIALCSPVAPEQHKRPTAFATLQSDAVLKRKQRFAIEARKVSQRRVTGVRRHCGGTFQMNVLRLRGYQLLAKHMLLQKKGRPQSKNFNFEQMLELC